MDSSESAVLEVSLDQTTDDSSSGSLDSHSLVPAFQDMDNCPDLIMEPGEDIVVKVDAPMKQMTTMETYVTYRVRCKCARWPTPTHIRRRYNHFKAFHARLASAYPLIPIPPLPHTHSAREQLDRYAASFVAVRTIALDAFLNCVAHHPILSHAEDLTNFVTLPEEEVDRALKPTSSGGGSFGLWGLTNLFSGFSGASAGQDQTARVKDPEFCSASDYLISLQQKLKTLHAITVKLFKDQFSMAKEMSEIKRITDAWSACERGAMSTAVCALGLAYSRAGHAARSVCSSAASNGGGKQRSVAVVDVKAYKALLPHRARYAAVVVEKIAQRDQLHAEYVATGNPSDLHNRLEQASEALRSELSDWREKNRSEIRTILLDIAEKQVTAYRQSVAAWDEAIKWCTSGNKSEDIFETCSKTAVANLSPAKSSKPEQNQIVTVEINSEPSRRNYSSEASDFTQNGDDDLSENGAVTDDMKEDGRLTATEQDGRHTDNGGCVLSESEANKTLESCDNSNGLNKLIDVSLVSDPLTCYLEDSD